MSAAIALFGNQDQTGNVRRQCDYPDAHHQARFWLATEHGAADHLTKRTEREDYLQPTGDMRRSRLKRRRAANCVQRQSLDGCVGEHVQRIGDQASRLCDKTPDQFDYKHGGVDPQEQA